MASSYLTIAFLLCAILHNSTANFGFSKPDFKNVNFDKLGKFGDLVTSDTAKMVVGGGVDFAMKSSFVPTPIKGGFAVGKALYSGVDTFRKTGDFSQMGKAVAGSGMDSFKDVMSSTPGLTQGLGLLKAGSGFARDIYDGKDIKSVIAERGQEAVGSVGGNTLKMALGAMNDIRHGESIQSVIAKNGKDAFMAYAGNNPSLKAAMDMVGKTGGDSTAAVIPGMGNVNLSKFALNALKDIKNGESLSGALSKMGKDAFKDVASNNPNLKSAMNMLDTANNLKGVLNGDMSAINNLSGGALGDVPLLKDGMDTLSGSASIGGSGLLGKLTSGALNGIRNGESLSGALSKVAGDAFQEQAKNNPNLQNAMGMLGNVNNLQTTSNSVAGDESDDTASSSNGADASTETGVAAKSGLFGKLALGAVKSIRNGESLSSVLTKAGKDTIKNYAENNPNIQNALGAVGGAENLQNVLNGDVNAINKIVGDKLGVDTNATLEQGLQALKSVQDGDDDDSGTDADSDAEADENSKEQSENDDKTPAENKKKSKWGIVKKFTRKLTNRG